MQHFISKLLDNKIKKQSIYNLRDPWDNIKCTTISIIRVAEEEQREKGPEKIFEAIIAENFLNMGKEIANQVQGSQKVPGRINPRRNIPRHIVIKLTKFKTEIKY